MLLTRSLALPAFLVRARVTDPDLDSMLCMTKAEIDDNRVATALDADEGPVLAEAPDESAGPEDSWW